jgi:hypothetical protein
MPRFQAQGRRPAKTHSTVFASSEYDTVLERVRESGVRYVEVQPDERLPYPRLWLGLASDDDQYDPAADGGVMTEVLPLAGLKLPSPPREPLIPDGIEPGQLLRFSARTFLVDSLSETLAALDRSLDLRPNREVVSVAEEGYDMAVFDFTFPGSARLELLEPTDDSKAVGQYRRAWGAGPYSIRVAAWGLDTWIEDARRRGIAVERLPASSELPERATIDPRLTYGTRFEVAEGRA